MTIGYPQWMIYIVSPSSSASATSAMKLLQGVASGEDGNLNRERGKGKSLQVELEFNANSVTGGERNGDKSGR
jgi:hypothetical protein